MPSTDRIPHILSGVTASIGDTIHREKVGPFDVICTEKGLILCLNESLAAVIPKPVITALPSPDVIHGNHRHIIEMNKIVLMGDPDDIARILELGHSRPALDENGNIYAQKDEGYAQKVVASPAVVNEVQDDAGLQSSSEKQVDDEQRGNNAWVEGAQSDNQETELVSSEAELLDEVSHDVIMVAEVDPIVVHDGDVLDDEISEPSHSSHDVVIEDDKKSIAKADPVAAVTSKTSRPDKEKIEDNQKPVSEDVSEKQEQGKKEALSLGEYELRFIDRIHHHISESKKPLTRIQLIDLLENDGLNIPHSNKPFYLSSLIALTTDQFVNLRRAGIGLFGVDYKSEN